MRTAAPLALAALLAAALPACAERVEPPLGNRQLVDLSGAGWSLLLDADAPWEDDPLHLPGVLVDSLPSRPPTGGWERLAAGGRPVSVPGTVEGETWGQVGDFRGVSWWWRPFELPQQAAGRRIVLQFDAVRLRAEVFVDERLVGYDAVGNTPFEVDLTGRLESGPHVLAVRVTDPGGNFDWVDHTCHRWGEQTIPASHGFGGITGPVRLLLTDALHVRDVFVRTTEAVTDAVVEVTVVHPGEALLPDVPLTLTVAPADDPARVLVERRLTLDLPPGESRHEVPISAPGAAPWSPDAPHLHLARVSLGTGDALAVRFGFRWLAPKGVGSDAVLRLNGRRIVLRSAISWGFWPRTGLVPTEDLAERQVRAAKALGLNMLNHHRTIAAPGLLDLHDELGLLAYLEPGGYWSQGGDELCLRLAREKWLRMVRRDRNHPCVAILNLINESRDPPGARGTRDLLDARALDPTRILTYTSAWADEQDESLSLHARPGDERLHTDGLWDQHHAPGPGVWRDEFWRGPDDFLRHSELRRPVVLWGEDGAIGSPPRLAAIEQEIRRAGNGWDGAAYLDWKSGWERDLEASGLSAAFPDVDALAASLADVGLDYHARVLENVRLGDVSDGFVINGWESMHLENHSGLVDVWRHPKGDGSRLQRANAPLVLAVKLRRGVARTLTARLASTVADVGLVNEVGLAGDHELVLRLLGADGREVWAERRTVEVAGGEVFGQMLAQELRVDFEGGPGRWRLVGELRAPGGGVPLVTGEDQLFLVDWSRTPRPPPGSGALHEGQGRLGAFLSGARRVEVAVFDPSLPPLRWIAVADVDPEPVEEIPAGALLLPDGTGPGLRGEYFAGLVPGERLAASRVDQGVDFLFDEQGPAPGLGSVDYSVRWTSRLLAPEHGVYRFHARAAGGVRLWIGGALVLDRWKEHGSFLDSSAPVVLEAGVPTDLVLEYFQSTDASRLKLWWTPPALAAPARAFATEAVRRVAEDGTTLLILNRADAWARLFHELGALVLDGRMEVDRHWLGGGFFVREHPLFEGLPVNVAMGREYQELVHYGMPRYGLFLTGARALVGAVSDHQPRIAAAVALVEHGRGRILLSALDLVAALPGTRPGPRDAVAQIVCNALAWAAGEGGGEVQGR